MRMLLLYDGWWQILPFESEQDKSVSFASDKQSKFPNIQLWSRLSNHPNALQTQTYFRWRIYKTRIVCSRCDVEFNFNNLEHLFLVHLLQLVPHSKLKWPNYLSTALETTKRTLQTIILHNSRTKLQYTHFSHRSVMHGQSKWCLLFALSRERRKRCNQACHDQFWNPFKLCHSQRYIYWLYRDVETQYGPISKNDSNLQTLRICIWRVRIDKTKPNLSRTVVDPRREQLRARFIIETR